MQYSFLATTFIVDIDGGKIVVANKDASRGSSLALHLQVQVSVREMFFAVPFQARVSLPFLSFTLYS